MTDNSSSYDAVVIGSDEVFNCLQKSPWGRTMQLFGSGFDKSAVYSYGASFGDSTHKALCAAGIDGLIADNLKKMKAISVRDSNSASIVKALIGISPFVNIDPVLVYNFAAEVKHEKKAENSMVIYAYRYRLCEDEYISQIKSYAEKHNLKTVAIGAYYDFCDESLPLSPFEAMSYIGSCRCIVTDTFHGTVFALKYGIPFATVVREQNINKLGDLLNRFGCSDRAVSADRSITDILDGRYDREEIKNKLEKERELSVNYLKGISL